MYTCIYKYIYIYVYMYIYVYIYIHQKWINGSVLLAISHHHPPKYTKEMDQRVSITRHFPPETKKLDQQVCIARHFTQKMD